MKAVIQRARQASVTVDGEITGKIDRGMLILLGVGHDDNEAHAEMLAGKIARLRIFPDERDVPNLSLLNTGFEALVVSQFTLMADTRKGNRPGFAGAAPPEQAEQLYNAFVQFLREQIGEGSVATGRFAAMMDVAFVNEGPYTVLLESKIV
ncbi:MAG: D-tyrosyl-tRNA(Tyr) deacylase [Ignavibacteriae bacterium]|nr:D-tyrosyl-tRNA(Tyr) deacylase [Ignavibacteriota bacterium]MCB9214766.1 D-tyrosyl-tRNA(Tyr) deacylase [Ignavibacteria bacterium]